LQLRPGRLLSTLAVVKEVAEPEVLPATGVAPDPRAPIPKQIRYIVGNEGCERFSFYGMRNRLLPSGSVLLPARIPSLSITAKLTG
jgi:hypothetical protein